MEITDCIVLLAPVLFLLIRKLNPRVKTVFGMSHSGFWTLSPGLCLLHHHVNGSQVITIPGNQELKFQEKLYLA